MIHLRSGIRISLPGQSVLFAARRDATTDDVGEFGQFVLLGNIVKRQANLHDRQIDQMAGKGGAPETTMWRCSISTGITLRRRRALTSSISMPFESSLRRRNQPVAGVARRRQTIPSLSWSGRGPPAPSASGRPRLAGCIAQKCDVMTAMRRIDRGRQTSLFGDEAGDRKASDLRNDVLEKLVGVAGRLLPLEHHIGPLRLEARNPRRWSFRDPDRRCCRVNAIGTPLNSRMPDRRHAIVQRPRRSDAWSFAKFVIVVLLQVDHDQQAAARGADIGSEIDDRAHRASADWQTPRLADFSRMPGRIPSALGTNQHVGIVVERDALRMLRGFQLDLDIVEIGKHQIARCPSAGNRATPRP